MPTTRVSASGPSSGEFGSRFRNPECTSWQRSPCWNVSTATPPGSLGSVARLRVATCARQSRGRDTARQADRVAGALLNATPTGRQQGPCP
jgi:hypothetical protein